MPKEVNIDEEDATVCGKYVVPFIGLIIVSLLVEQYWQVMTFEQQMVVILLIFLSATLVYRNKIIEMIYT